MAITNAVDATQSGFQSVTTGGVWNGRTFTAGAGISIANGDGTAGNPTITATGSAAITVVQQVFTANGTYTPTAGMQYCQVQMIGGGGAGGGAPATGVGQVSIGSAAGSGEYAEAIFDAATIGASQAVTIGAAGVGAAGAAGGNGGATSLGTLLDCNGGTGGSTVAAGISSGATSGGGGGSGGGGAPGASYRANGGQGGSGYYNVPSFLQITGPAGVSFFGGAAPQTANNGATSGVGIAGVAFGAGGGGAVNQASQAARAGGNGFAGVVIVTEYI